MSRALVVDDEVVARVVLGFMLRELGWEVSETADIKSAAALSKNTPFDVVFSDYSMPGGDGLDLLRELRRSGNDAKFVLVTGRVEHVEERSPSEADAWLTKPVSSRALLDCLRTIL